QIIFAGKAHPQDVEGKKIIRQIIQFAEQNELSDRIIFLEDYDTNIARALVRGVDLWLNNPRRPMEASGTSGMKAAVNGVLNISTLDGWWCEGYRPDAGWAVVSQQNCEDTDYQDFIESRIIYELLEKEVVPLFYTRSADNLPQVWISSVKNSIKRISARFNTHRMIVSYARRFYNPAVAKWRKFTAENMSRTREFSKWKANITNCWHELAIDDVQLEIQNGDESMKLASCFGEIKAGSMLNAVVGVRLGNINPEDISVELYYGPLDAGGNILNG
ncbi:unnamed protein product, partial [marine sediment metagenome]